MVQFPKASRPENGNFPAWCSASVQVTMAERPSCRLKLHQLTAMRVENVQHDVKIRHLQTTTLGRNDDSVTLMYINQLM